MVDCFVWFDFFLQSLSLDRYDNYDVVCPYGIWHMMMMMMMMTAMEPWMISFHLFIHSCIATSIDQSIKIFIDADGDDDDDGFFRISNFIL